MARLSPHVRIKQCPLFGKQTFKQWLGKAGLGSTPAKTTRSPSVRSTRESRRQNRRISDSQILAPQEKFPTHTRRTRRRLRVAQSEPLRPGPGDPLGQACRGANRPNVGQGCHLGLSREEEWGRAVGILAITTEGLWSHGGHPIVPWCGRRKPLKWWAV